MHRCTVHKKSVKSCGYCLYTVHKQCRLGERRKKKKKKKNATNATWIQTQPKQIKRRESLKKNRSQAPK